MPAGDVRLQRGLVTRRLSGSGARVSKATRSHRSATRSSRRARELGDNGPLERRQRRDHRAALLAAYPASSRSTSATVRAPSPARSRANASSMPSRSVTCVTTSATGKPPARGHLGHRGQQRRRVARAVVAAADALLGQQLERRQRDLDAGRRDPDDRRGRARRAARPRRAGSWPASRPPRTRGRPRRGASASTRGAGVVGPAGRTASVAPRASASASFAASRSTAMIRPAPASRAAATSCSPTPPQPITQTRLPGARRARRCARRPTAVTTPQPSSAACHSGSSAGTGTAHAGGHDAALGEAGDEVEVLDRPTVREAQARACRRAACPPRRAAAATSQRLRRPGAQARQRAARRDEAEGDADRRARRGHALADRLDDAGALVAEDDRVAPLARGGRRPGAGRSGRRRRRPRARAPRPRAAARARARSTSSGVP